MWVASVDRIGGEPDNSIEYVTFSPATWSSDNARRVNQTYACNRRASKLQSWTDEHGCAIMTTVRGGPVVFPFAFCCSTDASVAQCGSWIRYLVPGRVEGGGEERGCWICAHDVEC